MPAPQGAGQKKSHLALPSGKKNSYPPIRETNLSVFLEGSDLELVLTFAEESGVKRELAKRMHPSLLLVVFQYALSQCLEKDLVDRAIALRIPVESLDDSKDLIQMNLEFEKEKGASDVARGLATIARERARVMGDLAQMTAGLRGLYLAGDERALMSIVSQKIHGLTGIAAVDNFIRKPRHINWYPKIDRFQEKVGSPVLVVGGLAHILLKGWEPMIEGYASQGRLVIPLK